MIKLSIDNIRKTVLSIHFIKCYCSFTKLILSFLCTWGCELNVKRIKLYDESGCLSVTTVVSTVPVKMLQFWR